jgi:hypothetical protein
MPTPRNLAGAPSGVNIFGDSEYPNAASGVPQRAYPEVTSIGLHTAANGATGGGGTGGRFDCGLSNRSAPICAQEQGYVATHPDAPGFEGSRGMYCL